MTGRRLDVILCAACGDEIEFCDGREGDWMHTATRREACPAGGYATPAAPSRDYKPRECKAAS